MTDEGARYDGAAARARRKELNLTLRQVSERSGVSEAAISELENARRNPSPATVRAVSKALGSTPRELGLPEPATTPLVERSL